MSKDQPSELSLNQFMPYRLNNLATRISQALASVYESEFGISIPEWRVVAVLGEQSKLTAKDICQITIMDKTKVSRAVHDLNLKGLISKSAHETDNRATYLSLSGKGRKLYEQIKPKALDWEQRFLKSLQKSELNSLRDIIEKLELQIQEMS